MNKKQKMRFVALLSCMLLFVCTLFHGTAPVCEVKAATTATTKIMPLGDSITDCDFWRTMLFNKLTDNGFDVQSVGTQYGGHEGHSGMLVTDLAKTTQLSTWLQASDPDIVMMLFGTNDCWCDKGATAILAAYETLVGQMRAYDPNMTIVIGKVTPLIPNFTSDYVYRAEELALAIDDWAADLTTEQSPIYIVDHFTGFDAMNDTYDGVHPNATGSEKICNKWYDTLSQILSGQTPVVSEAPVSEEPVVSETPVSEEPVVSEAPVSDEPIVSEVPVSEEPVVTTEPVVSEVPSSDLELETSLNAWSTGYTMNVNVKNNSSEAVSNWKLVVKKADFTITNVWCAEVTESGDYLIITPMSWNSTISAGGYANFGFQGTGTPAADFEYTLS